MVANTIQMIPMTVGHLDSCGGVVIGPAWVGGAVGEAEADDGGDGGCEGCSLMTGSFDTYDRNEMEGLLSRTRSL